MLKAMVFVDFENFDIARLDSYKAHAKRKKLKFDITQVPKLDFCKLAPEVVKGISKDAELCKTFLFAPKPDDFLMTNPAKAATYNWINGMKNLDYITIIEGRHASKPAPGCSEKDKDINDKATYIVNEKGTDVNLACHLLSKAYHNAYDIAVVLSGDTDFIPVYNLLNAMGKTVVVAGVKGQNLTRLKEHTDSQFIMDIDFFKKCNK